MNPRAGIPLLLLSGLCLAAWYVLSGSPQPDGTTHTYYVAADEVVWDYAPSDSNLITGQPFGEAERLWVGRGPNSIGHVYKKALYREYTDGSFTTLKPRPARWEHLGLLGPLLRAEVGDTIVVVFKNNASFPASVHPHGVFYTKDSEGAPYNDGTNSADKADDGVPPGGSHTYIWPVPERAGPGEEGGNSAFWMYHSHTDEIRDVNAGLIGPIIINARGTSGQDGTPKGIDREFVVAFDEVYEAESWYIRDNLDTYTGNPDSQFVASDPFGGALVITKGVQGNPDFNFMESMNGFVYGNLPGLKMKEGEHVRWYLMASTGFEFHTPHWHGNTVKIQKMNTDVASLLPMGMVVADMVPDNPGTWLFHCHVGPHLEAGMQSLYTVEKGDLAAR